MAVTTTIYQNYAKYAASSADGIAQINHADASAGTFKLLLLVSASVVVTHSVMSQVTADEIGIQNYASGGVNLANVTFTVATSGTATFDADDIIVTASGADLSAQAAVIFKAIGSSDRSPVMIHIDFGQTETAGDGTTFQIQWNAGGIVQFKP